MDVATLLKSARTGAGLTQVQLAQRAGTSQAAVARYERGRTSPAVDTLERLLACCGRSLVMDTHERDHVDLSSPRMESLRRHRQGILGSARRHGIGGVRVFGSVARGEDREDSDVDLLVDFDPHRPGGLMPIVAFAREVQAMTGERIDVAPECLLKPDVRGNALRDAVAL